MGAPASGWPPHLHQQACHRPKLSFECEFYKIVVMSPQNCDVLEGHGMTACASKICFRGRRANNDDWGIWMSCPLGQGSPSLGNPPPIPLPVPTPIVMDFNLLRFIFPIQPQTYCTKEANCC
eukprot:1141539-Pelagomonas_calceolata.AAC.3